MSRLLNLTVIAVATFGGSAFAGNGFASSDMDTAGFYYHGTTGSKSRDEVKAELQAARADGSMVEMGRNRSYVPVAGIASPFAKNRTPAVDQQLAKGQGEVLFDAPAAGGRTREDVLNELLRARADGSLRRLNSNRSY